LWHIFCIVATAFSVNKIKGVTMAIIKFGAGISEMRGKEGGIIYSRNAFGSYIKTKVSPINPNSQNQQTQRGLMGNLAHAWSTLSAANKASWENLATQVTRTNRFGDQASYTGFSLFMRLNRNLSAVGVAMISTAPVVPTLPILTVGTFTATKTGSVLTLVFSPTTPGATMWVVVYLTNNIIGGRKFVKNYMRLVFKSLNPTTSPLNLYSSWNTYFGVLPVSGSSIFAKAKIIDQTTGFDGVPVNASAVWGA
jgi:hypothetical protein